MATRARNAKGHFIKSGKAKGRSSRPSSGGAMVVSGPRTITKYRTRTVSAPRRRSRRRGGNHGGGVKLTTLALATLGLAYVTGSQGPAMVTQNVAKLPGVKTFGGAAIVGGVCLAIDRFAKPNKWLKLFGTAGVVLAAARVGDQGTKFSFVGDADDVGGLEYTGDVEGDDDVGDYDDVGDDGDD